MSSNMPNLNNQKKFIIENAYILNKEIKINILSIIMETEDIQNSIISENVGMHGVNINLDIIESINPALITHIYNIIKNRLDFLSKPLKYLKSN
jgi:hypothetical protein